MIAGRNKEGWERHARSYRLTSAIAFGILLTLVIYMLVGFAVIRVSDALGFHFERASNPRVVFLNITILCLIYAASATFFLVRKIFKPIEELGKASAEVAKGDFDVELQYEGKVIELRDAINNFNRMVKELNSVEIMRNDFIADVSHEFKTPLSAISGYATLLQDSELSDEDRQEYIRKIFFNIDRLNDLTENILRLSKLEHQQYGVDKELYRLDEQLREAVVLLEPKWSRKKIEIDIDLPDIEYLGARALLFQVWTNLIDNAIKYTDMEGKISIRIKTKKNSIRVMISDNGIGMDENTQKHIFDKFYQGDTSRKSQGNGLGLALCKDIVEKSGGEIYVESTLQVGTVFIVKLPVNEYI